VPKEKEFYKPPHPIIVERGVMRRRGGGILRGNGYFGFSMMLSYYNMIPP